MPITPLRMTHSCRMLCEKNAASPVGCSPSQRPAQTPSQSRIPQQTFLCHVVLQGGQALLLLQNSHPGTSLSLTHTHPSIRSVSATQTEQQQQRGISFLLWCFYLHMGGWEQGEEKCRSITIVASSTHCWNIYDATCWILLHFSDILCKQLHVCHLKHIICFKIKF